MRLNPSPLQALQDIEAEIEAATARIGEAEDRQAHAKMLLMEAQELECRATEIRKQALKKKMEVLERLRTRTLAETGGRANHPASNDPARVLDRQPQHDDNVSIRSNSTGSARNSGHARLRGGTGGPEYIYARIRPVRPMTIFGGSAWT